MTPHVQPSAADRWIETAGDVERQPVALHVGKPYLFRGFPGPRENDRVTWAVPPGEYKPIGLATHVHTWQELVVYVGLVGADRGKMFACTLADWARNFAPNWKDEPPPPEPPRTGATGIEVVGRCEGSGF